MEQYTTNALEPQQTPMIYSAVSSVMEEIGAIGKSKRNQQQGFQYRGVDDVMNALHPLLVRHGLFVTPTVLEHTREERPTKNGGSLIYSIMKVRYTMYAQDGSSITSEVIGEGMDSADKSSNKALAVAFKYAMFQIFCIPTEELVDPDSETPPPSQPMGRAPAARQSPPARAAVSGKVRALPVCAACHAQIRSFQARNGNTVPAEEMAQRSIAKYGRVLCVNCARAEEEQLAAQEAQIPEDDLLPWE